MEKAKAAVSEFMYVNIVNPHEHPVPYFDLFNLTCLQTFTDAWVIRHKAGHHDTTVHEKVAPAVVNEKIIKHRHEEATTAIDREIHQDHYHTSIQPVFDREVLPEKHVHNVVGVETREHRHGDAEAIKAKLEQERLQFKNTRVQGATHETHSAAPVIAGEHVHHHVHEVRQSLLLHPMRSCLIVFVY